jgi:hypothetical protein
MEPTEAGLQLPDAGENVLLWREDDEVAMAVMDAASFACIEAIACGSPLACADASAQVIDSAFDWKACMHSLMQHDLIVALDQGREEPKPCR